jgi:hypothetical protein
MGEIVRRSVMSTHQLDFRQRTTTTDDDDARTSFLAFSRLLYVLYGTLARPRHLLSIVQYSGDSVLLHFLLHIQPEMLLGLR